MADNPTDLVGKEFIFEYGVDRILPPSDKTGDIFATEQRAYRRERVERPAPKVLDADGVEIRVGDEVWTTRDLDKFTVTNPNNGEFLSVSCKDEGGDDYCCYPTDLTHRAPVLAADGRPLCEGETVWDVLGNRRFKVLGFCSDAKLGEFTVKTAGIDGMSLEGHSKPSDLTHERPESWERIEEDLGDEMAKQQCGPVSPELACSLAGEFVRRCRALAERERGE